MRDRQRDSHRAFAGLHRPDRSDFYFNSKRISTLRPSWLIWRCGNAARLNAGALRSQTERVIKNRLKTYTIRDDLIESLDSLCHDSIVMESSESALSGIYCQRKRFFFSSWGAVIVAKWIKNENSPPTTEHCETLVSRLFRVFGSAGLFLWAVNRLCCIPSYMAAHQCVEFRTRDRNYKYQNK